jgi:predicted aldo/keto reductase-like oxidoreductase
MTRSRTEMDRRRFLKSSVAGIAGAVAAPSILAGKETVEKRPFVRRTLGKTGLKLPVISMGVMNAKSPELVAAALDAGVVHLDTAWIYQNGQNERMVGKVVKDRSRDSFVIATKIYERRDRSTGLFPAGATGKQFLDKFEASLRRLQMDYVDILYIHNISIVETLTFEPFLNVMLRLKEEGRVRFLGVSTHQNEPAVIRAATDCGYYDVILTSYTFRQKHHREVAAAIDYAAKKGMGIVGMKAIAGFVQNIGKKHDVNAKAALKWALRNENIHTNIPGITTFEQLETDLSIMKDLELTAEEKMEVGRAIIHPDPEGLFCQQCGRCLPQCPRGLDIPTLMRSYMYARGYRNLAHARTTLEESNLAAGACGDCESCSVRCATGFDVRTRIRDVAALRDVPEEFLI